MKAKVSFLVVSFCSVRAFLRTQKSFIRKLLDFDSSHLTKHKYKLKRAILCHSLQLLTIDITDQYYGCSLSHFQAGNAGNTSLVVAAVAATNGHGKTRRTCGSITYRGTRMWAFFPF